MRVEKNGFVLVIEGTWLEISNKYGVIEYGDTYVPDIIPDDFAEKMLDKFIDKHSVKEPYKTDQDCIKRVAYDDESKEYIQLQAIRSGGDDDYWTVQKYDNELVYMGELFSGCKYHDETLDWMRTNFDIESCLIADVFRSGSEGNDCTNNGISSKRKRLYILSATKGPFEPQDIRECVYIEWRNVMGSQYINCKPAYYRKRWYMAGGNFLYTSDSRFGDITKCKYPISIHDRYEGR